MHKVSLILRMDIAPSKRPNNMCFHFNLLLLYTTQPPTTLSPILLFSSSSMARTFHCLPSPIGEKKKKRKKKELHFDFLGKSGDASVCLLEGEQALARWYTICIGISIIDVEPSESRKWGVLERHFGKASPTASSWIGYEKRRESTLWFAVLRVRSPASMGPKD